MFRNLRINIFIYYFLTVSVYLGILYYFLNIIHTENIFLLITVILSFVTLSAFFISKLAIDPLQEYATNLQNLSKETLHELNLPISTIMTNTHLLKKRLNDEKSLKRIKRVESACEMLKQRYNELDYLIKTQSTKELDEYFSLDELLRDRIEFLQQIYPHIQFKLKLQKTTIRNDKIGLSKAIDNIIDNGVKYSLNSNIIEIKLLNNILYIKDYGRGMDEVELLKIFDNYYQSNKNMQGFGIGLSMVKRFCDTHSIGLSFDSKPEKGTTVLLKFKED